MENFINAMKHIIQYRTNDTLYIKLSHAVTYIYTYNATALEAVAFTYTKLFYSNHLRLLCHMDDTIYFFVILYLKRMIFQTKLWTIRKFRLVCTKYPLNEKGIKYNWHFLNDKSMWKEQALQPFNNDSSQTWFINPNAEQQRWRQFYSQSLNSSCWWF